MSEYERQSLGLLVAIAGGISAIMVKPSKIPVTEIRQEMNNHLNEVILNAIKSATEALQADAKTGHFPPNK